MQVGIEVTDVPERTAQFAATVKVKTYGNVILIFPAEVITFAVVTVKVYLVSELTTVLVIEALPVIEPVTAVKD